MEVSWFSTGLLALVILYFIFTAWKSSLGKSNLPPGPTPLPIIGNALLLGRGKLATTLMKLKKKYGPVYTVYFGSTPVVVLSDYEAVKEALIDQAEEFSGRGALPTVDQFINGYGLIFSNGSRWKDLRRFTLTILRNFGMGKKSIEARIQEEAGFMVTELRSLKGKSMDPTSLLVQCVSNVICSVVFGDRFEYNNTSFQKLLTMFNAVFKDMSGPWGQLMEMLPNIMKHIPGPHKRVCKHMANLNNFIMQRVKMNQETFDPNSPRDYIDCFLIKQQQEKDNSYYDMKNMVMTLNNLFFAGTETVSTTLRHGLLLLMRYPEIQAKLHKEIDTVIGDNRIPTIDDRSKMPYMDAVIHEIQRFSDVIPLNVPHLVTKDTQFRGFTIPKVGKLFATKDYVEGLLPENYGHIHKPGTPRKPEGTDVYPLLCTVLRDPKMFSTPDRFNPNHFLDSSGRFKKNDAFMPFSTGKRICAGEGLARMELFLFLTTILQNFTLTSKTKFTDEDVAPKMSGFANMPIFYEMSFIPRLESM